MTQNQLNLPIKVEIVIPTKPRPKTKDYENKILIPVKPAVRKWVLAKWGNCGKVHVESKNMVGQLMLNMDLDVIDFQPDSEATALLEITFARRDVRWAYNHKKPQILAGKFLFSQFALAMITWVDAQVQAGRDAYHSLESFLNDYDITEEEYSLESAYRYYQKWKPYRENTADFKAKKIA